MAITDNLISWWDFNDGSGNATDEVGTNDLTPVNGATYTAITGGNAADIPDTGNDYFELPGATNIDFSSAEDRTFAFRVKRNSGTSRDRIMGIWDGTDKNFLFIFWDSGQLNISSGHGSSTDGTFNSATTDISDGSYHTVIATYSGSIDDKWRIYVDGATTPEATSAAFSGLTGSDAAFRLGYVDANTPDMEISWLGIWDTVLDTSYYAELHNSGAEIEYADLGSSPAGFAYSQSVIAM